MIAKLINVIEESDYVKTFYFKPEKPIRHVAGQFIELTIPHNNPDTRGVKRWFTISSAPGHEVFSITTKFSDKPSSFKAKLLKLNTEDEVIISEAMGDFVLPKKEDVNLVFIAGGIGITPFHSIIQWLLDTNQSRKIELIYSVNNENEVIFNSAINQNFIDLHLRVGLPNLTVSEINKIIDNITKKQIYISGPEAMTESLVDQFKGIGINQDKLITDYFPGYGSTI